MNTTRITSPVLASFSPRTAAISTMLHRVLMALVVTVAAAGSAKGQGIIDATGTFTAAPGAGNTSAYTLMLQNNSDSTSPIGSFWFGWVPGQFYLPSTPSSAQAATGWTENIVNGGGASSIQFVASSSSFYLAPGSSLSFEFNSADPLAVMEGNAPNHPTVPVTTSVVYGNGLFSTPSETIVFGAVPEPSTLALVLAGCLGWRLAGKRRIGIPSA